MKKVYECWLNYTYKNLVFTCQCTKFFRYVLGENEEDTLNKYKELESQYITKPLGARKILEKEFIVKEYNGYLATLKEEINFETYLELVNERLSHRENNKASHTLI